MNPDTFLDDQTIAYLADDLRSITRNHPELLRIARRETSPPGGRAARNPNGYQSRPPVNLAAMSTSHELHTVIGGWARCLRDDAHIPLPGNTDTGTLAAHLAGHTHEIAQQQWADDCADEMRRWAKVLQRVTSPPPDAKYLGPCQAEGKAQCRGLFTGDGRNGYCGTCEQDYDPHAVQAATQARIEEGKAWQTFTAAEIVRLIRDTYKIPVRRHHIDGMLRRQVNPLTRRGTNIQGQALYTIKDVMDRLPRKVKEHAS